MHLFVSVAVFVVFCVEIIRSFSGNVESLKEQYQSKVTNDIVHYDWEYQSLPLQAFLPSEDQRNYLRTDFTKLESLVRSLPTQQQNNINENNKKSIINHYSTSSVSSLLSSQVLPFKQLTRFVRAYLYTYQITNNADFDSSIDASVNNNDNKNDNNNNNMQHRMLQTKGTNCVLIERGQVPRYYDCNGCVIDRAQACIDDLRLNKSGNVHPSCPMKAASVRYLSECCPQIVLQNGRYNLQYLSAGYAMTLRCLQQVSCSGSVIYSQLERECKRGCPMSDPRTGLSVCYANFNSGFSSKYLSSSALYLNALFVLAISTMMVMI